MIFTNFSKESAMNKVRLKYAAVFMLVAYVVPIGSRCKKVKNLLVKRALQVRGNIFACGPIIGSNTGNLLASCNMSILYQWITTYSRRRWWLHSSTSWHHRHSLCWRYCNSKKYRWRHNNCSRSTDSTTMSITTHWIEHLPRLKPTQI
jgi:hypothetical protein